MNVKVLNSSERINNKELIEDEISSKNKSNRNAVFWKKSYFQELIELYESLERDFNKTGESKNRYL